METAQCPLSEGVIDLRKPSTSYVYRAYDDAGNLLYVGAADNVAHRLSQHKRQSAWYPQCITVEWEEYPDRTTALRVEAELIQALRPPHNTVHNRASRADRLRRAHVMRSDFTPVDRLLRV